MPASNPVEVIGKLPGLVLCAEEFSEARGRIVRNSGTGIYSKSAMSNRVAGILEILIEWIAAAVEVAQLVARNGHQRTVA